MKNLLNKNYYDFNKLKDEYLNNDPFPHIVLDDFIQEEILLKVYEEFPDLGSLNNKIDFNDPTQIKLASKGSKDLSKNADKLISFLNSDIFLNNLQNLTGISETLISDPYLSGGGYHQIKNGGVLKVHADFNKHPLMNLDRRVNLLIYINKGWKNHWGGSLELYSKNNLDKPIKKIEPVFNRCVIFNTTSYTYHGHPKPLKCPEDVSRKSIALYYFSVGRPSEEVDENKVSIFNNSHSTLFVETKGETFQKKKFTLKKFLIMITPPFITDYVKYKFEK